MLVVLVRLKTLNSYWIEIRLFTWKFLRNERSSRFCIACRKMLR